MGLSFHEMQAAAQEMSLRAVFDEDLSNYTLCDDGRYEVYTEYTDDAVSEVDKHKNITVNEEQCNLTQEENSQYVPFKLPRYWDGVDLMTKLIQFHYVNINGGSGVSTAVNVRFNDSYIICGWLINKSVTAVAGDVTFEITATGTNEKSADYRWRTRPNGKFTVLEALSYDGIIEPSDDWYAGFVKSMQEYTTKAAESARSAQDYADQSKSNLDQVTQITETFTTNAQEVKETAINEINNAKVSGVNAVEAAATEIVNDREKITENANNISSLKGDLTELDSEIFARTNNLANPEEFEDGYISAIGIISTNTSYAVTGYISVNSGDVLQYTQSRAILGFDSTKTAVSSTYNQTVRQSTYTVPDGIYYVRIAMYVEDKSKFMANKGDALLPYEPYKISRIDDIESDVSDLSASFSDCETTIDSLNKKFYDHSNLANPDEFNDGILTSLNTIQASADYFTTGYIRLNKNDRIAVNYTARRIVAVSLDKSTVVSYVDQNTTQFTATADCYVRLSIYIAGSYASRKNSLMVYYGDSAMDYIPYMNPINFATERTKVVISASDGIQSFYEKMEQAFSTKNCDVYIGKGDYIYTNDLVDAIRSKNLRGIRIGNGCHYYFEAGATLYCEYTGTNKSDVANMFSPLDSNNIASDWLIENLHLVAKNTLYALHDEAGGSDVPYSHIYKNCYLELDNTSIPDITTYINKALGGGLGKYAYIEIDGCVFSANNPYYNYGYNNDASYHGANSQSAYYVDISVKNSWFRNNFRMSNNAENTDVHGNLLFCGNSTRIGIVHPFDNAKVFCNEIRE